MLNMPFVWPLLYVYVFPSPSPPDWFLCSLCHPAVDEWCCLTLWRPGNTSFCFIFSGLVLWVWMCYFVCFLFGFVYIFLRKCSLTPLLIAPLIRTSSSHWLCCFKQICVYVCVLLCAYVCSSACAFLYVQSCYEQQQHSAASGTEWVLR